MLPKRIPKPAKRESRWRSTAHCNFVRSHACSVCGSTAAIEVAHVRIGTGTGMAQKPDDWNTVSLCRECHASQHHVGERTFWEAAKIDPLALAAQFAKASPKAREIADTKRERKR
jgi:5-methylcytosine-specific restriction endonuclease McrA